MSRGLSGPAPVSYGYGIDRRRRVGQDHPRSGAPVQREGEVEDIAVELPVALAQGVVELRPRGDHRRAQALLGLTLEAVLQGGQEREGRGAERHRRGRDEGEQQPRPQAEAVPLAAAAAAVTPPGRGIRRPGR